MTKKILESLPPVINVKITKTNHGKYFAEFPEYDVFTEADNREDLYYFVNDLIFTYFDIPKKYQKEVWYMPKTNRPIDLTKVDNFNIFIDPYSSNSYCV